jgi:hypothetical protein
MTVGPAVASNSSNIVGIWFGRGEPEDKSEAWLDHINADGTWVSEFETCHGKIAFHHVESGTWRMDNGVERDFGQVSDGRPTHFEFDYATVSNNGLVISPGGNRPSISPCARLCVHGQASRRGLSLAWVCANFLNSQEAV